MNSNKITLEIANLFEINPEFASGLAWKNPSNHVKGHRKEGLKNMAGSFNNKTGYWQVRIPGKFNGKNLFVYTHRLIWIIKNHKEIPEGYVVDHISTRENKPENLRLATRIENAANSRRTTNRQSGLPRRINKNSAGYFARFRYAKETYRSPTGTLEEAQEWLEETLKHMHGEFFSEL